MNKAGDIFTPTVTEGGAAGAGGLFIVSAASGAGKTTLVNALVQRMQGVAVSVSYTTRPKRPGERHAEHYYFITDEKFTAMVEEGAFLEHAEVFGYRYGTSRARTVEQLSAGVDLILEIDWQGARQVKEALPDCVGIFILPTSRATLESRLRARKQDSEAVIERRLLDAVGDMSHYREFDYLVINDDFETAVEDLIAILRSWRLRRACQAVRYKRLVDELLG